MASATTAPASGIPSATTLSPANSATSANALQGVIPRKCPPQLEKFIIFNPTWGNVEGMEYEKVIYYWSPEQLTGLKPSIETQVKDVSLCEALIKFVNNLDQNQVCESVHGLKTRMAMEEVEPNYWFAIRVSVPHTISKSNDGKEIVEYHEEELNDRLLKLLMQNLYRNFRLCHETITGLWERNMGSLVKLRTVFIFHLDPILHSYKIGPQSSNILSIFGAIHFLPLDNLTYMQVQSFCHHVQSLNSNVIRHYMFLYQEQLVTSSISLNDTKVLYHHLIDHVIPEAIREELNGEQLSKTRWIKQAMQIYLHEDTNKFYILNVFRSANGATLALIMTHQAEDILSKAEALMASRMLPLATKLADTSVRISTSGAAGVHGDAPGTVGPMTDTFKFVYCNQSNGALKSSNSMGIFDQRRLVDSDLVKLIVDIDSDLKNASLGENVQELMAKTAAESWLVVRKSDERTLFSLLNHKNANLAEASDTVTALSNHYLENILFVD